MTMKRRHFLKTLGWGLGGSSLFFLENQAMASRSRRIDGKPPVLVIVFQRGGMDGLMAVQPLSDTHLEKMRPRLFMKPEDGLIELDHKYGLHPAFAPLFPYFQNKSLAVIHGAGLPGPVRSHFDAQDYMETGTPDRKGTPDGWLNRLLAQLGGDASPLQAVAFSATMPRAMTGPAPAFSLQNLKEFKKYQSVNPKLTTGLSPLFQQAALQAESLRAFSKRAWPETHPSARYSPREPGLSLRQAAQLIKADVGVQLVLINSRGWDTHRGQGTTQGAFSQAARPLAQSLAAFQMDLGHDRNRVLTLTMTEFGRTAKENGTGGTDHGRGSCFFAMGSEVRGGRVHGKTPDLKTTNLAEGRDLPVTCDYRAVLCEVLAKHFHLKKSRVLFPGWTGRNLRFLKS